MKKNELYITKNIKGVDYLFPIGQKLADHKRAVSLNESSSLLIKLLENNLEINEIIKNFIDAYDITDEDKSKVSQDIVNFISGMQHLGIVDYGNNTMDIRCDEKTNYFFYGNISVAVNGDSHLLHDNFNAFSSGRNDAFQKISLIGGEPKEHYNGAVIVRTNEIIVMHCEKRYIFLFPQNENIFEMQVSFDGRSVYIYYNELSDKAETREHIFHAMRFAYLIAALNKNIFVLHSASIVYKDRVWLFSASSGTGKTTHTNMWKKLLDVELFNGDLNAIGYEKGLMKVYGIPWCGTSEIYSTQEKLLGGIVFLKRDCSNHVEEISETKKIIMFLSRIITPIWNSEMLKKAIEFAERIAELSKVYVLFCNKEESAVWTIKEKVDRLC